MIDKPDFFIVGRFDHVSPVLQALDHRPVMGAFNGAFFFDDAAGRTHFDFDFLHTHVPPLAVVEVLQRVFRVEALFIDVGAIWTAGGGRDGKDVGVSEHDKRCAHNGEAVKVQV